MNSRPLIKIIALLLVSCLAADPALAASQIHPLSPACNKELFTQEALSASAVVDPLHPIPGAKVKSSFIADRPRSFSQRVWDVMKWAVRFRISLERLNFHALRLVWSEPRMHVPSALLELENRQETWAEAMPTSGQMFAELYKHQIADKLPMTIDPRYSKGCLLATLDRDANGKPYYFYDFNHFAAKTLGDNRPETMKAFMDNFFEIVNRHAYSDFVTQAYYDYVMMMMSIAPKSMKNLLLVNSGAEANENAIKAAKLLRGEKAEYVIRFDKAFHGRTGQALSATDNSKVRDGFFQLDFPKVPYPEDDEAAEQESLKQIWAIFTTGQKHNPQPASYTEFETVFSEIDGFLAKRSAGMAPDPAAFASELRGRLSQESLANAAKAAAIIIEGYEAEGGIRFASPRFFQRLTMLANIYDVPWICDEIQSGMFITGKAWAHEQYDLPIPPDIVTTGKKAQMGVVYFSDKYTVKEIGKLNSTWGGSESGMVRAVSYQEVIEKEGLVERINRVGAYTLNRLETLQEQLQEEISPGVVSGARGRGLVLALDLKDKADRDFVMERALRRGLILNAAGSRTLRILPRYDTPTYHIDAMLGILAEAVRDLERSKQFAKENSVKPAHPAPPVGSNYPMVEREGEIYAILAHAVEGRTRDFQEEFGKDPDRVSYGSVVKRMILEPAHFVERELHQRTEDPAEALKDVRYFGLGLVREFCRIKGHEEDIAQFLPGLVELVIDEVRQRTQNESLDLQLEPPSALGILRSIAESRWVTEQRLATSQCQAIEALLAPLAAAGSAQHVTTEHNTALQSGYPLPAYKTAVVEPIRLLPQEERIKKIEEAGFNLFNLRARDVFIDLLTDSGTGAMSKEQKAAEARGDESYAGSDSFFRLQETIEELLGFHYVLPAHQGRGAEQVFDAVMLQPGQLVVGNRMFDTTTAHIEHQGGQKVEFPIPESRDTSSTYEFKGNVDLAGLRQELKSNRERIAYILMTVTDNSGGGEPVSMSNLKAARQLAREYGVPYFGDIARFAENAMFIKRREPGYADKPVPAIVREMMDQFDGVLMSAKKEGLVPIGAFIAVRDEALYEKLSYATILMEGFPTYGGMSGATIDALAQGLHEIIQEDYLNHRLDQVNYFGQRLIAADIPIVEPVGGHAVYIDARKFFPHIPPEQFPGHALAVELYIEGGIRGVEVGSVMTGPGKTADSELFRLAIPRRVYGQEHFDYIVDVVKRVYQRRDQVVGMKIVKEPPVLRHFKARFARVSPSADLPAPPEPKPGSERKTNPLATGQSGNPGRALTLIELPVKTIERKVHRAVREIIDHKRLIYGLTWDETERLTHVLDTDYSHVSWRYKSMAPSQYYAAYYDDDADEVIVCPQDAAVTFRSYPPGDLQTRAGDDPLLAAMHQGLQDHAFVGHEGKDFLQLVRILERHFNAITVEIRDHHDFPETVIDEKAKTATIILPRYLVAALGGETVEDLKARELLRWVMLSEMGHLLKFSETDETVEPLAAYVFNAVRGVSAFLNLHTKSHLDLANLIDYCLKNGVEAAVKTFALSNPLSRRVVKALALFASHESDVLTSPRKAQALRLMEGSAPDEQLSYLEMMFDGLWKELPNRTYVDLDGSVRNRLNNPSALPPAPPRDGKLVSQLAELLKELGDVSHLLNSQQQKQLVRLVRSGVLSRKGLAEAMDVTQQRISHQTRKLIRRFGWAKERQARDAMPFEDRPTIDLELTVHIPPSLARIKDLLAMTETELLRALNWRRTAVQRVKEQLWKKGGRTLRGSPPPEGLDTAA